MTYPTLHEIVAYSPFAPLFQTFFSTSVLNPTSPNYAMPRTLRACHKTCYCVFTLSMKFDAFHFDSSVRSCANPYASLIFVSLGVATRIL